MLLFVQPEPLGEFRTCTNNLADRDTTYKSAHPSTRKGRPCLPADDYKWTSDQALIRRLQEYRSLKPVAVNANHPNSRYRISDCAPVFIRQSGGFVS